MKPELTPELKEKFAVQYWGQNVLCMNPGLEENLIVLGHHVDVLRYNTDAYLLLRPMSSLTDEEAFVGLEILLKKEDVSSFKISRSDGCISFSYGKYTYSDWNAYLFWDGEADYERDVDCGEGTAQQAQETDHVAYVDYLRSINIALPFMGHSVEELVEAGWVKLRES